MSLTRMGKQAESVRFLDDLDLTFTLDSRSSETHQSTSIEVAALPIVFRASYRDIMLIMNIVNKAIELYGKSTQQPDQDRPVSERALSRPVLQSRKVSRPTTSRPQPIGSARVVMNKEQVSKSCVVIIGWYSHIALVQRLFRGLPSGLDRRLARTTSCTPENQAVHPRR